VFSENIAIFEIYTTSLYYMNNARFQFNPNLQIEIYDLQGRLVTGWKQAGLHAIDVQPLIHGLYILRLSDGSVHRFIKL
jgi:hypothetical protein